MQKVESGISQMVSDLTLVHVVDGQMTAIRSVDERISLSRNDSEPSVVSH
jgi:hypothetical protein